MTDFHKPGSESGKMVTRWFNQGNDDDDEDFVEKVEDVVK
jgi:hypothetical protein